MFPITVLSLEFHQLPEEHQLPEKKENLGKDNPIFSSDVPEKGGNEGSENGYVCRISLKTIQALCLLRDVNNVEVVVA